MDIRRTLDQPAQTGAHHGMIIRENDAYRHVR
jgi:hypothetical protein